MEVIKLFLDREFTAGGDEALAQAMQRIPVVLQARIEPETGTPDDLPGRVAFHSPPLSTAISGDRGWIPIPRLAAAAADIGFVDFADEDIPLLENYRGKTYKSVIVCALELQSGARAHLGGRQQLMLGTREFGADRQHAKKVRRALTPLPAWALSDLLSGKIGQLEIAGRVVILGYTGSKAPVIATPAGGVSAHVFFGQCLRAVFEGLQPALTQRAEPSPAAKKD